MNAKHLIWNLTAASLLASSSVGVAGTEQEDHQRHGVVGGPLPRAVREATERSRNVGAAIAGYVESSPGDASADQTEARWEFTP
jgi:hypothetical protein